MLSVGGEMAKNIQMTELEVRYEEFVKFAKQNNLKTIKKEAKNNGK